MIKFTLKYPIYIYFIFPGGVVCGEVLSCDSCGRECTAACGTRQFRACCFNYLRKRAPQLNDGSELDPGLRLELWLARSGAQGLRPTGPYQPGSPIHPRFVQAQLDDDYQENRNQI